MYWDTCGFISFSLMIYGFKSAMNLVIRLVNTRLRIAAGDIGLLEKHGLAISAVFEIYMFHDASIFKNRFSFNRCRNKLVI